MIPAPTFRAIVDTSVAWLAAGRVSPAARQILEHRLAALVEPHARDLDRPRIASAAFWLGRAGPDLGVGREEAERELALAVFDFFLDRAEDASRAALPAEILTALGIERTKKAA